MKHHFKSKLKYLVVIAIILFVFFSPFKIIKVQGSSMYPTYVNNQLLLAIKTKNFQKNDVVVCNDEGYNILKRIKFIEGETVYSFYQDTNANVKIISYEEYKKLFNHHSTTALVTKTEVSKNQVFLLGDNLNNSDDSRRFGCVNIKSLKYKIIYPL
jgi:signal peptidase I